MLKLPEGWQGSDSARPAKDALETVKSKAAADESQVAAAKVPSTQPAKLKADTVIVDAVKEMVLPLGAGAAATAKADVNTAAARPMTSPVALT